MLQRGPIFVGDLKPVGTARPLAVVRPNSRMAAWATISVSCLSILAVFAAGAVWLVPRSTWTFAVSDQPAAPLVSAEAPPPATFPSWVEVPHLTGPLSHADDPDTFSLADGPRSFLDPNPTETAEQTAFLPPRANPRLPLISRAPLDAARLTQEQPPVWNERTDRQDVVTSVPPSAVATLEPDARQPSQSRVEMRPTQSLPASPTLVPILPPGPAPVRHPTEAVVRPAPPNTAAIPPGRVAILSPDPTQQVPDRAGPVATSSDAQGVIAPVLNPGPARHARSLRRLRAATTIARAPMPYRDAEKTTSILSLPTSARTWVNAGAVAHASLHRSQADRSAAPSPSPAPPLPWTMPPALAPTD